MANVAELAERPSLRCFGSPEDRQHLACGRLAVWQRSNAWGLALEFFCDVHHRPGDEPITADALFRRIDVDLEARVSATSLLIASAHAEAVDRLERAIRAAGGTATVARVTSVVGRLRVQPGQGRAPGAPGGLG